MRFPACYGSCKSLPCVYISWSSLLWGGARSCLVSEPVSEVGEYTPQCSPESLFPLDGLHGSVCCGSHTMEALVKDNFPNCFRVARTMWISVFDTKESILRKVNGNVSFMVVTVYVIIHHTYYCDHPLSL